jgi:hypothetical protein
MPQTSGQILGTLLWGKDYYQGGRAGSIRDIQVLYSEKGTLDSHERNPDNWHHKRRQASMLWVVHMFPVYLYVVRSLL